MPVFSSPARFKVLIWHRKAHKTTLAINELIRWATAIQGTYWYVAPFYGQAKKIVWEDPQMLPKYCPPQIWANRNNTEMKIPFPNGSILYVLGADKPDSLRGPNPHGVILDEYGDMKSDIWNAIIQPIMTANPLAWTWFIGTPKGRNDFWTKYQYARDNPNWYSSMLKASESGIITKDALLEAKKTSPEALYNQEYECEFVEGAGAFFRRIRQNTYDRHKVLPDQGDFQLGVDLAKHQDWTVITPFNVNYFIAYPQDRFNQIDWNLQKARIEVAARRHSSIDTQQTALIWPDATGVGDPIVEDLKAKGLRIGGDNSEGFKFTEISRQNLLNNLAILLEQDRIKIPDDEGLLNELESFRYELTERGKIKVGVPDGLTDDRVMSLALSVWGINEPIRTDTVFLNQVSQRRAQPTTFK